MNDPVTAAAVPCASNPAASLFASRLGRMTLRMGNYPGRSLVGTMLRKKARKLGGRSFYAQAADGTRLAAWFSPAATSGPDAASSHSGQPRPLPVVFSHGWCEVKEFHFRQAWLLNQLGHDVILFDHRSHGRSGGRYVTFGVRERYDLTAVVDHAIDQNLIQDRRFITIGFSLGAATVLQHAAIDPRVAGVVAYAPYVDFRQAILSFRDSLAPWMRNDQWLLGGFAQATQQHGFNLDEACTLQAVRSLEAPVLLVEAGRDRNLPPAQHTRKLLAAKTQGPIEVVTIADASHRTLCRRKWPGLTESVVGFCNRVT